VLTQCPNCETTFRVTSEILRVAEGQVRCGRCQTQFDALQRLIDERPPPGIAAGRQPRTAASAAVPAEAASDIEVEEERETLEEITMEGKRIEISGTYRVLDESGVHEQLRREVVEEWMEIDEDVVNSTIAHDDPESEGIAGYERQMNASGLRLCGQRLPQLVFSLSIIFSPGSSISSACEPLSRRRAR